MAPIFEICFKVVFLRKKNKFELSIQNQFWRLLSQNWLKGYLDWRQITFFKQSTPEYVHVLLSPALTLVLLTVQFIQYMSHT